MGIEKRETPLKTSYEKTPLNAVQAHHLIPLRFT